MKRLLIAATLLALAGTGLVTSLHPAGAGEEPTPSTSCNQVGVGDLCLTTPTQACISDRPMCPFSPPVCYYNGQNPTPVGQLSCHENAPPPDPTPSYSGVCVQDGDVTVVCVGGPNQSGDDRTCPWLDIVLEPFGTVDCREW